MYGTGTHMMQDNDEHKNKIEPLSQNCQNWVTVENLQLLKNVTVGRRVDYGLPVDFSDSFPLTTT